MDWEGGLWAKGDVRGPVCTRADPPHPNWLHYWQEPAKWSGATFSDGDAMLTRSPVTEGPGLKIVPAGTRGSRSLQLRAIPLGSLHLHEQPDSRKGRKGPKREPQCVPLSLPRFRRPEIDDLTLLIARATLPIAIPPFRLPACRGVQSRFFSNSVETMLFFISFLSVF